MKDKLLDAYFISYKEELDGKTLELWGCIFQRDNKTTYTKTMTREELSKILPNGWGFQSLKHLNFLL